MVARTDVGDCDGQFQSFRPAWIRRHSIVRFDQRNWTDLCYAIAIVPSAVTIRSIESASGFFPSGVREAWLESDFNEATVKVTAETFCLQCHTDAKVGDVLGTITLHTFPQRDFAIWSNEVRLAASLAVGKIVLHSVLLFLILRARIEPLLRLCAVVSSWSKAYAHWASGWVAVPQRAIQAAWRAVGQ